MLPIPVVWGGPFNLKLPPINAFPHVNSHYK